MGGMQITVGATYEPVRTDDPPGTMRTRSLTVNRRAGKVYGIFSLPLPIADFHLGDRVEDRPLAIGNWKSSNALALAADQHSGHVLSSVACFRKRGVRPVPARMVGVMSSGASLAVVALPATGSVQTDLVRSSHPIFVDVEIDHVGGR